MAYLSQAALMNFDMLEAYRLFGMEIDTKRQDELEKSGMRRVRGGIVLSVVSLLSFIAGSWLAMSAISWRFPAS
jgi:hypothetical protein